jgi:hypothetical protein
MMNLFSFRQLNLIALAAVVCFSVTPVRADEGMWLPLMLEQLNQSDMQMKGFRLTAADVYSINHTSMKDAVVQFGGGCTGEIVSSKGLLFTNHHCGFGQIQSHSSLEHNYLENGFWAKTQQEELVNPGLTVTFIIRMEDITEKILRNVSPSMNEFSRDSVIKINGTLIGKESIKGTHYESFYRAFYNGNQYFLFITETFRDVRLVGAPPASIGKFGSDADNWVWPRHTGDFSVFRIYSNKNNEPADYSPENIPYTPKYFFPISLKGEKEGDFSMVYGFPGRTNEYLYSGGVDLIQNVSDPAKVGVRDVRLSIMNHDMHASEKVHIQYASKQSGIANGWKKWSGEIYGLNKNNAIGKKKAYELEFQKRVTENPAKFKSYENLLAQFKLLYDSIRPVQLNSDYFAEVSTGIEAVRYALGFDQLVKLSSKENPSPDDIRKQLKLNQDGILPFFKDYNRPTDEKICAALLKLYYERVPKNLQPTIFRVIENKYGGDFEKYTQTIYTKSIFTSQDKITAFLTKFKNSDYKKIAKDPVFVLMKSLYDLYRTSIAPRYVQLTERLNVLNRTYMKAQMDVMTERKYYPDANLTLRVTYGKVGGYVPRDGVIYNWYTTLDGIMQKEDSTVDEFHVAPRLKELWSNKDYGRYADSKGELHVAFVACNHTSGGNSGSPVMDADGLLIGINFDRCWEGTMSDEAYDLGFCRNISVDVRYVLFVMDKFAGAGYLLNEMKLVN